MVDRPHVLFVVNNYPPHLGGVQLHVRHLARHLVRRGLDASVIALADTPEPEREEDGVKVVRLPRRLPVGDVISFPRRGATHWITEYAREHGVTAVSVHTRFFPMSTVGSVVARRIGAPVIHTEHGSDFVRSGTVPIDLASRVYDLAIGRRELRTADRLLAVSPQAASFVRRLSGRDAEVFYNAIDVPEYTAVTPHDDRPTDRLVFIGRLVPGKGWREALQVHRLVRRERPDLSLDLIGSGPELAAARQLAGEEPGVVVHGRVEPSAVPRLIAGATLLNPTTLSEGFQTTLLEALAAGGRVVTYPVPGAAELARLGRQVSVVRAELEPLTAATSAMLDAGPAAIDPELLAPWDWGCQAARYEQIVIEETARRN